MQKQQPVKLESYNLQDLANLKKSTETDLQKMMQSHSSFKMLQNKINSDKIIINNLSKREPDDLEMLVPLSSSLYLPGRLTNNKKYLVDIGTGYLVERNVEQTIEALDHTLVVVNQNSQKAVAEITKRRDMLDSINLQIHKKYEEQMKQQQGQQQGQQQMQTGPSEDAFKKKR